DPNHRLMAAGPDDTRADKTLYQQIIGSLMYLVTATRPDLAYTITHLSQFNSDPSQTHYVAAKRVLKYLKGTRDFRLVYPFGQPLRLSGYSDASYGNCFDTRRSFSGYLFQLGHSTISWRSRKQKSVSTSTCEAEYMALSLTCRHFVWLKNAIKELLKLDIPSVLFCDNSAAIDIAHNPKVNDRSKHIDIAYHYTRERVQEGEVALLPIPSADNLADICTKGLLRLTHNHLCIQISDSDAK